ncbi:MAG TPA: hypothetical protein VHO03_16555 [Ignavibacteriales bacterium]|nr:hypothetical protein [Ignavibacteriales bacterium]
MSKPKNLRKPKEKKNRTKFGKFNVSLGAKTPKGELHTTRIITKEHSIYPFLFNEDGTRKEPVKAEIPAQADLQEAEEIKEVTEEKIPKNISDNA